MEQTLSLGLLLAKSFDLRFVLLQSALKNRQFFDRLDIGGFGHVDSLNDHLRVVESDGLRRRRRGGCGGLRCYGRRRSRGCGGGSRSRRSRGGGGGGCGRGSCGGCFRGCCGGSGSGSLRS